MGCMRSDGITLSLSLSISIYVHLSISVGHYAVGYTGGGAVECFYSDPNFLLILDPCPPPPHHHHTHLTEEAEGRAS